MKINKTQILYIIIFALLMSHVPWINWFNLSKVENEALYKKMEFEFRYNQQKQMDAYIDSINAIYDNKQPIVEVREVVRIKWREKADIKVLNLDSLEKIDFIKENIKTWKN